MSEALRPHVPEGVRARLNIVYDAADGDARLDLFQPNADPGRTAGLATLVWVHGGGWVAGSKEQIANYLRIVASRGFNVVGVGYSLAPGHRFPTPLRQLDSALLYLAAHAQQLGIDARRIVLAGDSAGAQIVRQYALAAVHPPYATRLSLNIGMAPGRIRGLVLFCGAFELGTMQPAGSLGRVVRAMLWSYWGEKNVASTATLALMQLDPLAIGALPPMFISVGDADPLDAQSRDFADQAVAAGVAVDSLFFDATPPRKLGHEYQFNLDLPEGREALQRMAEFIARQAPAVR